MAKTILAIFNDRSFSDSALNRLNELGYDSKSSTVLMKDKKEVQTDETKIVGGAVSAVPAGTVIGGVAGFLAGVGAIAIPEFSVLLFGSPIIAGLGLAGVITSTATGAAIGGIAGGLLGGLNNLGIPEQDAKVYEEYVRADGILLTVTTKEKQEHGVHKMLEREGAIDVKAMDLPQVNKEPKDIRRNTGVPAGRVFDFGRFLYG